MKTIPLCVSEDATKIVHDAGARWNTDERVWCCTHADLQTDAYEVLKPFVSRRYKPDIDNPVIRPWMVPQSLWGKNLRAVLKKSDWDFVRKSAYQKSGHRCCVCGGQGPKWPVEADEAWAYDDERHRSTLKGVIALCPSCHAIRHWGRTSIKGQDQEQKALGWMMELNRWSRREAIRVVDEAMAQWHRRSKVRWTIDYSWVSHVHNIDVRDDADERAEEANREIVSMALRNRGGS